MGVHKITQAERAIKSISKAKMTLESESEDEDGSVRKGADISLLFQNLSRSIFSPKQCGHTSGSYSRG